METFEQAPLTYDEAVDRYGIEILRFPGDLVLRNGDIAVTKSGDLMLNDPIYSALYRFVQTWRFNAPALKILFDLLYDAQRKTKDLEAELETLRPMFGHFALQSEQLERYHEINDRVAAYELSSGAYAGSIVLVLSGLLLAFKDDMDASRSDWDAAGPLMGGCSIGAVLAASANNFRHHDEWVKTRHPKPRQLTSVLVLAAAFGKQMADIAERRFSLNISPETIELISEGDFERLSAKLFAFVNDLANRTRA